MRLHLLRYCLISLLAIASFAFGSEGVPEKPFVPKNRWALVVGVSQYLDEIGKLKYTSSEAKQFAECLETNLGFEKENIKLLRDGQSEDAKPTSANVLASLDALLKDQRLDKANLFVFYFSGHGVGTKSGDYLLPADTTKDRIEQMGIPVREVITRIVQAGLKNVLFIADACRAGTENGFGQELTALCHDANIAVILGCSPGKRSYEYRELKQGAFTHFLLESIKDSKLRDASGSVWASKIGSAVQKSVHDYTEPDYGKYAQVPSVWAEQTTLDVLLATYPQPPVSDEAINVFQKKAQSLSKREYAVALSNYAEELFMADRYDKAIELLTVADHLEESTPKNEYLLASSLLFSGRVGEAERIYKRFESQPPSYYRDLAVCGSSSKQLKPGVRVEAAMRMLKTSPSWSEKMYGWASVNTWGSYEEKLVAAALLVSKAEGERQKYFASGCLADLEGDWANSLSLFEKSYNASGESPTSEMVFYSAVQSAIALGTNSAFDRLSKMSLASPETRGFLLLHRAMTAKGLKKLDQRLSLLKQALGSNLDPSQLWLAVRIAGPYIGQLQDEFKAAAEKHPYSWRARVVMSFVRKMQGDSKASEQDALASDRYIDDPLNFACSFFDLMDSFMSEAVELGTLKPETYREQLDFYFLSLLEFAPKFGYDADIWGQFIRYGMFNERTAQVSQVVKKYLPFNKTQVPASLRPSLMLLALNEGDFSSAISIFSSHFEPTEKSDPGWFRSMMLMVSGQPEKAAKLAATLGSPSADFASQIESFKTLLLAKTGKVAQAKKRLVKAPTDIVSKGLTGLTWAALGNWKKAEPLLLTQAKDRVWTFLFVQEYAMRVLDEHYRSQKFYPGSRILAHSALISQPGNPLFFRYSFTPSPGVKQFAGSIKMKGLAMTDRQLVKMNGQPDGSIYSPGVLSFTIATDGKFAGQFLEDGSNEAISLSGKIDGFGNLTGTGTIGILPLKLSGKIAPPNLYSVDENLKRVGQALQLIDPDGYRLVLLARP